MKVSKFIHLHGTIVLTVNPDFTLVETARKFAQPVGGRKLSLAVVCDDTEQVIGVVSLGDMNYALARHGEKAAQMLARDVMNTEVATCAPDDNVEDVLQSMAKKGIRHMPVVENGKLAGLLSRRDALEFLYHQASLDVESLSDWLFVSEARY
jgi:CBS domain-containing protein